MNRWNCWAMKIAWRMPRWVVKWCLVRAVAHATTGKYADTVVNGILAQDVLDRWEDKERTTPDGWNPWNKVVHRNGGEVDPVRTNIERALRGLPVPWHPSMATKEVGEGPCEVDRVEMELRET
jgi:hypothetical protein